MTDEEYEHLKRFGVSKELHEVRRQKAAILKARKLVKERKELRQLQQTPQEIRQDKMRVEEKAIARGTTKRAAKFGQFIIKEGIGTINRARFRGRTAAQQKQPGAARIFAANVSLGSPMGLNPSLSEGARDGTLITGNIADKDFFGSNLQQEAKDYYGEQKQKSKVQDLL